MGLFQKPKFKKLNKATGKWETVTPEPQEFNTSNGQLTLIRIGTGRGSHHKNFDLVLLESKMAKR